MSEIGTVRVTPAREQIAEEIRALLARRRLSISELARQLSVTQPYLSRRLTGDVAIDVDDLYAIARLLGVEVAELLPRGDAGRTVVVAGEPRESRRSTTVGNHTPTTRPRSPQPVGHPQRMTPPDSSRRPVRLSAVSA